MGLYPLPQSCPQSFDPILLLYIPTPKHLPHTLFATKAPHTRHYYPYGHSIQRNPFSFPPDRRKGTSPTFHRNKRLKMGKVAQKCPNTTQQKSKERRMGREREKERNGGWGWKEASPPPAFRRSFFPPNQSTLRATASRDFPMKDPPPLGGFLCTPTRLVPSPRFNPFDASPPRTLSQAPSPNSVHPLPPNALLPQREGKRESSSGPGLSHLILLPKGWGGNSPPAPSLWSPQWLVGFSTGDERRGIKRRGGCPFRAPVSPCLGNPPTGSLPACAPPPWLLGPTRPQRGVQGGKKG